ncbi:hypothetical protein Tco_0886283 [Tanacetum coccineum]
MSTAEVEYVSLSACFAQVIWMRTQFLNHGFRYNKIPIYYDSKSAIAISCNPVQHLRTKYINIRYHFIKEHIEQGDSRNMTYLDYANMYTFGILYIVTELLVLNDFGSILIVSHLLKDHSLSSVLTSTIDVPRIYMQQFWKKVKQVPNAKDTIRFMVNKKDIIYTMDTFSFALKLTAQNLCLTSRMSEHDHIKINVLQMFHGIVNMCHVDYPSLLWTNFIFQVMQSKQTTIQHPRFTTLIIADLMEKYPSISKRLDKPYHIIKDDTPLSYMYTTK